MSNRQRVGIFGGTFDPVHHGHLIIAELLAEAADLDHVLFLPAHQPPHKPGVPVTPDHHRLAMLELAIAGNPRFGISLIDFQRSGASYTSDSLQLLQNELGARAELYFMIGEDSLRDFPTWHRPDLIVGRAILLVAPRPGIVTDVDEIVARVPEAAGRIEVITVPEIDIAATDLRRRLHARQTCRYLVPDDVLDYIERNNLYLNGADNGAGAATS